MPIKPSIGTQYPEGSPKAVEGREDTQRTEPVTFASSALAIALNEILQDYPDILPLKDLPEDLRGKIHTPIFQRFNPSGTENDARGDQRQQLYLNEIKRALADQSANLSDAIKALVSAHINNIKFEHSWIILAPIYPSTLTMSCSLNVSCGLRSYPARILME